MRSICGGQPVRAVPHASTGEELVFNDVGVDVAFGSPDANAR